MNENPYSDYAWDWNLCDLFTFQQVCLRNSGWNRNTDCDHHHGHDCCRSFTSTEKNQKMNLTAREESAAAVSFFCGEKRLLKNIYQKSLYMDTPLWYYLNIPGGGIRLPPIF